MTARKPRVLVVDDEPDMAESCAFFLDRAGYEVATAQSGFEALESLDRQPYSVVITDVKMPRMSGATLAERVRHRHPDVKIIFVSGFTEESIFGQVPLDPNITFVQKPYTPRSILRVLREVLDRTGPGVIP